MTKHDSAIDIKRRKLKALLASDNPNHKEIERLRESISRNKHIAGMIKKRRRIQKIRRKKKR